MMNQRTGQSGLTIHATILVLALIVLSGGKLACAQGVATGGTAVPARPLPPGMKAPTVTYEDLAVKAGLTGVEVSGADHGKQYIPESTGTGVAIFDYDNDGLPDIFLVNGGRLGGGAQPKPFLYHNLGGLKFEDVTEKAGITSTGWGQGICAGDIDNDGNTDVFVTQWGQNILYRNQGNGTFRDETKERGLLTPKPRWSTGCAFLDFNRDGYLDLVVVHYVDFDLEQTPRPGDKSQCQWKGLPVLCGPRGLPAETLSFYENDGKGRFTDVSDRVHIAGPKNYYGFTALTGDFDNDGWPDIFVACDSTPSLLFHNNHDGTFAEVAVKAGVAYNEDGREEAGMGAHAGDYDGDGWPDIIRTNFSDDTSTLYHNNGDGTFTDVTYVSGLGANTQFLGWGTLFVDVDNDGWPDLFVANGHVYPEVDENGLNSTFRERKVLYWNQHNGKFKDISLDAGPGITAPFNSHGVAAADFDNDGGIEILVNNSHDAPSLLKNNGEHGSWISLKLVGTKSNRDAIGAHVTVSSGGHQQLQEVRSGGGYISQNDFRLHFGLGG